MSARREPRVGASAGFTLIETLVALVVFAVVAVVAQRGMVTARLGLERARTTLAAEQVARSIVETQLDTLVAAPGDFSGQIDGLNWTISATPIVLPLPPAPPPPPAGGAAGQTARPGQDAPPGETDPTAPQTPAANAEPDVKWLLLRVLVSVENGRAKPLTVEAVHLVKDQTQ